MSRVLPIAVGALIVGLIAGITIGRAHAPAPSHVPASKATQKETPPPQHALSAAEERGEVPDDPAALKEIVVQQRAKIDTLTAQVAESKRSAEPGKTPQDKLAFAKEIYEAFVGIRKADETGEGAGNYLKALGRLDELDESMVSFFVEKYRKATGEERELAQGLAMCCGGREAAEFVKGLLKDSSLSEKDRNDLLQAFGMLGDGGFFPAKPFPVDPELAQMAFQFAESPKTEERTGAAGLLGHYDDPASRAKLQQLAGSDSDWAVRGAAIVALGKVGDRSTLAYLNSYPTPSGEQSYLQSTLKGSIAKLKKRFPE